MGDAVACSSPLAEDGRSADRAACSFAAGALGAETLGVSEDMLRAIPIDHIIVMMKENRSYDHYFGQLHVSGQADSEPAPATFTNPDLSQRKVGPFHLTATRIRQDPGHQWAQMHDQIHNGLMDGFVRSAAHTTRTDGHFAMGFYDAKDLPFYYFLANTFAIADRHFPSVRSGTWSNRDYLLLGTSDGVRATQAGYPRSSVASVFDSLDTKSVSWGVYTDHEPFEGCLNWPGNHAGLHDLAAFKQSLADGTLPSVAYVDSQEKVEDEHSPGDVQVGENWTREIYEALVKSPLWASTALIWTYDEAGGFADHVPPPNSCVARPEDSAFFELGVRVPLVVISPWARRHYVSHVVHEHTSILRFIEAVFGLPALTARDANSDALLDMFDFSCPPRTVLPDAPASGAGHGR
jgi:phospholipase C